jgi:hypothetical protein
MKLWLLLFNNTQYLNKNKQYLLTIQFKDIVFRLTVLNVIFQIIANSNWLFPICNCFIAL